MLFLICTGPSMRPESQDIRLVTQSGREATYKLARTVSESDRGGKPKPLHSGG